MENSYATFLNLKDNLGEEIVNNTDLEYMYRYLQSLTEKFVRFERVCNGTNVSFYGYINKLEDPRDYNGSISFKVFIADRLQIKKGENGDLYMEYRDLRDEVISILDHYVIYPLDKWTSAQCLDYINLSPLAKKHENKTVMSQFLSHLPDVGSRYDAINKEIIVKAACEKFKCNI